jgi:WD40 repeat protein
MDFGLAKREAGEVTMTLDCEILGTPAYMSPEQARGDGHAADARSDIYSLGVVLYLLLTGDLPFRGNPRMLIHQVQNDEPRSPRSLVDTIPRDLETICLKAMAKEPSRRYATSNEFAADLSRFLSGEPILARPVGGLTKLALWAKRNPRVAWLSAAVYLLLVALAAGGATGFFRVRAARVEARNQLVRLNLQNGVRLVQGGVTSAALPWLVQSLKSEAGVPARESIHRTRIASVLRGSPRPIATWAFDGPIQAAAFSPDGKRILIAGGAEARVFDAASGVPVTPRLRGDGEAARPSLSCSLARFDPAGGRVLAAFGRKARIWKAVTGELTVPPIVHAEPVTFAAFSPDGKLLVTCSGLEARLIDLADGRALRPAFELPDLVRHASFSPDGRHLLVSFGGPEASIGAAWLFDLSAPGQQPVYRLDHSDDVYHCQFSPDGRLIVTASYDRTARIWNARSGEPLAVCPLPAPVRESWFSPDGQRIVSVSGHQARIWNAQSSATEGLSLAHDGDILHAEFSRDGAMVVTCGADRMARVWDTGSGELLLPPIAHNGDVTCASLSADGRYLLTASSDRSARIWDLSAATWPTQTFRHGIWVSHGEISPDGRHAVVISRDGICRVWNLTSGKPEVMLEHGHRGDYATFSPDGQIIATVGYDGAARVWDARTGRPLSGSLVHARRERGRFLFPDERIHVARFDRSSGRLLTYSPREAIVWGWRTGRAIRTIHPEGEQVFSHATFNPDGTRVLTAESDGMARLWRAAGDFPPDPVFSHGGSVLHATFSNDGRRVLTCGGGRAAKIWDASRGKLLSTLAHGDQVNHGSFSPDGTMVVTASDDRTAGVWSTETGKLLVPFLFHDEAVLQAYFSGDGRLVATGSGGSNVGNTGEARVWDASTGDFVTLPMRHGCGVRQISFSPDGRSMLTTAYKDGTARLWVLSRAEQPIDDLERIAKLFAAVGIDETGGQVSVAPEELTRLQSELASKYPDVFRTGPAEIVSWLESEAGFSVKAKNWEAAALCYGRLLELDPASHFYLAQRGWAEAGLGRWKEAAADLLKAIELGSDDLMVWDGAAILCLWNRDRQQYRELCDGLLSRYGQIKEITTSNQLAYLCSIGPEAPREIGLAVRMARRNVEARPNDSEVRTTYAATLYRSGELDEAIRQFDESLRLNRNGGMLADWLFLAMASARVGRDADARRWLDKAEKRIEADGKILPGKPAPEWTYPLHDQILRAEARERILAEKTKP